MLATKRVLSALVVAACLMSAGGAAAAAADRTGAVARASAGRVSGSNYAPLPAKEVREITSVTPTTLAAVGEGEPDGNKNSPPRLAHVTKLTKGGKPEIAYVIAEWCPYCAAENWSVAVALSRFGKLGGLTTMASRRERGVRIQTMSFRYSHFRSAYLSFDPIVYQDAHMKRVDSVPRRVRPAWHRYSRGFPFIDFAGRAVLKLASFDPDVLAHHSRQQIAAELSHPKLPVAQAIDGTANQLTAAICIATKDKPARVCHSKVIARIRRSLK